MREIKFRGKSKNEWVYGHLLKTEEDDYGEYGNEHFDYLIQANEVGQYNEYNQYYITDNETIGQYTGLRDKNGVEIYEGDILKVHYIGGNGFENNKVIYDRGAYCVEYSEDYHPLLNEINHCCEVIGNIYDNRDLLKESD